MVVQLSPARLMAAFIQAVIGFTSSLYRRRTQYIIAKRVDARAAPQDAAVYDVIAEVECALIEKATALRSEEMMMPTPMRDSLEDLAVRLREGCLVFLATRPVGGRAEREVVGYCICERGVFSALGRKMTISPDFLFTHYLEVVPEYRGLGVADSIRQRIEEWCRASGITTRCSVVSSSKIPSLKSSLRAGFRVIGSVKHVSILDGLLVWDTPWKKVEAVLKLAESENAGEAA